jgi:hypothetical protein
MHRSTAIARKLLALALVLASSDVALLADDDPTDPDFDQSIRQQALWSPYWSVEPGYQPEFRPLEPEFRKNESKYLEYWRGWRVKNLSGTRQTNDVAR